MSDNLRTRIAAVIYNACDEYTRKLMVRPDCPGASELEGDGKPVCYTLADAVIRELSADCIYRYACPHCGDFWFDKSERMQRFALLHGKAHR